MNEISRRNESVGSFAGDSEPLRTSMHLNERGHVFNADFYVVSELAETIDFARGDLKIGKEQDQKSNDSLPKSIVEERCPSQLGNPRLNQRYQTQHDLVGGNLALKSHQTFLKS